MTFYVNLTVNWQGVISEKNLCRLSNVGIPGCPREANGSGGQAGQTGPVDQRVPRRTGM